MKLFLGAGGHGGPERSEVFISELKEFLGPEAKRILFIPYALDDSEYDLCEKEMIDNGFGDGFEFKSIHHFQDAKRVAERAEVIFMGGGNTFTLLDELYARDLMGVIRRRVTREGMPYIGASAGSNVACPTIMTTNDMPVVYPPSFDALNLVTFQINPHYTDGIPEVGYRGEKRAERIEEYQALHDKPVVGMREGSILVIDGSSIRLLGTSGAKMFIKGEEPREYDSGSDLSWLFAK